MPNSSLSPFLKAIFFDLDGTLLDTAPDIAQALNALLKKYHRPPVSLDFIRPAIAKGTPGILEQGFGIDKQDVHFSKFRQELLDIYQHKLSDKTCFFEGMEKVLRHLDKKKITWGIVTNKLAVLAKPLLAHFGLNHRYACLVTGDSISPQKPHPAPLLHACKLTGSPAAHSAYVGDTEEDMLAAQRAGMTAIAVSYGYHSKESPPESWSCDQLIHTPLELIDLLP